MNQPDKGRGFPRPLILVGVLIIGIIGTLGAQGAIHATNNLEFCISCHEMRSTVFEEYKKSVHYSSRTGVRATCADCHVQQDNAWALLKRKVLAANDVWHWLAGTIDTPEKFEAKRLELAQRVWDRMKASDSATCRSCHRFEAMNKEQQRSRAWGQHSTMKENGETCIDCHKGIVHKPIHKQLEPEEPAGEQDFSL